MTTDHFAGINDGDKVRVVYEGEFLRPHWDQAVFGSVGSVRDHKSGGVLHLGDVKQNALQPVSVTVLQRAIPPEPPRRTVAVDTFDRAWQALSACGVQRWYQVGGGSWSCLTWRELNSQYGPLRVIWTPDAPPST